MRLRTSIVDTREEVEVFYRAALDAGATSQHSPAVHRQYHPDYFGGFVIDPHGINLEAVCHRPQLELRHAVAGCLNR